MQIKLEFVKIRVVILAQIYADFVVYRGYYALLKFENRVRAKLSPIAKLNILPRSYRRKISAKLSSGKITVMFSGLMPLATNSLSLCHRVGRLQASSAKASF